MSKKHKCKLKSLPKRNCKNQKVSLTLRRSRRNVNYDDNKYDALEYLDESENLSETIEISSEDSKEKKDLEENHIENIESGCSSDVVILEDETVLNEDSGMRIVKSKSTTNNSLSSAVSFSSSETRSSRSANQNRKSKRIRKSTVVPVSEEIFYVEKILDMKIENGKKLFFLKWEGFSDSENTWEPEENIQSNIMVQEFLENLDKNSRKDEKTVISEVDKKDFSFTTETQEKINDLKNEDNTDKECEDSFVQNSELKKTENSNEIIINVGEIITSVDSKHEELEVKNEIQFSNSSQKEIETVLKNNILCGEDVDQVNFDKGCNEECLIESQTCDNFVKDDVQIFESSAVCENQVPGNVMILNSAIKIDEIKDQIQSETMDCTLSKDQMTKINKVIKKTKRKGSKIITRKYHKSNSMEEKIQDNLKKEIDQIISNTCGKSSEINIDDDENPESISNENSRPPDCQIFPLSVHSSTDLAPENNEQGSCTQSVLSSKKTKEKSSKDPNSYFPNNMPQTVQEIFMVEKILNMKIVNGVRKFLLKWEGFPDSENTWEPEENLECPELIKEFIKDRNQNKKKRKRLSSDDSLSVEELPDEVQIKEPAVKKRGFPRSREADCILAAGMMNDQLMFLIKWKNIDMANLVSARRANIECPQVVIRYYEQHLNWKNNDDTVTSMPKENLNECENSNAQKNRFSNYSTSIKDSIDYLVSQINVKYGEVKKNTPIISKPKIKPKPIAVPMSEVVGGKSKKKTPKANKSFQEPNSGNTNNNSNQSKPLVCSSSQSMMNLIRSFKDRKSADVSIKPPQNNVPVKILQSPILDNCSVNQKGYESRDIPTNVTPQKIELPKLNTMSVLRSINSFKGDLSSRKFAMTTRPYLRTSQSFNQPSGSTISTSNLSVVSQFSSPHTIGNAQASNLQSMTTNVNNLNFTTAPQNVNILSINPSSTNQQLPGFNTISLNNFNGHAFVNQPNVIATFNGQQQIPFNQYLQLAPDGVTDQSLLSQCYQVVSDHHTSDVNNSISTAIFMSAPPPSIPSLPGIAQVALGKFPPDSHFTDKRFKSSILKSRSFTTTNPGHPNSVRLPLNQSDPPVAINSSNNVIAIQGYNDTRMQLAVALQSRYQQNSLLVKRPNTIVPSTTATSAAAVHNSGVIYQGEVQHPISPYQFISQPNFISGPVIQQQFQTQQQQKFYNPQDLISPSSSSIGANNTTLILPKLNSFLVSGDVGQHLLQQQKLSHLNNNI